MSISCTVCKIGGTFLKRKKSSRGKLNCPIKLEIFRRKFCLVEIQCETIVPYLVHFQPGERRDSSAYTSLGFQHRLPKTRNINPNHFSLTKTKLKKNQAEVIEPSMGGSTTSLYSVQLRTPDSVKKFSNQLFLVQLLFINYNHSHNQKNNVMMKLQQ